MTIHAFAGFGDFAGLGTEAPAPAIPGGADIPRPDGPISMPGTGPGLPTEANNEPGGLLVSYLTLGVRAVGGYMVGQALAPTRADKRTYGMMGAAAGGSLGVIALGVMAFFALGKRGSR